VFAFAFASVSCGLPVLVWGPIITIAFVSLLGDRLHLSQLLRLAVQTLFGGIAVTTLLQQAPPFHDAPLWLLALVAGAATLFVVGTANYYNFMDGVNGIAAITGALAFLALALHSHIYSGCEPRHFAVPQLAVACACLGFLPFNFPKAQVFMGDVGSILLGTTYAVFAIALSKSTADFVCLTGYLFMFYADEVTTAALRLKNGENLFTPHRRHVYQVLANQCAWKHWQVTLLYGSVQAVLIVGLLLLRPLGVMYVFTFMIAALTIFSILSVQVRKSEFEQAT